MEHYRIYPIAAVGHIAIGHSVNCDTDEEAFREAADLIGDHPAIEVWRGTVQVRRFTAAEIVTGETDPAEELLCSGAVGSTRLIASRQMPTEGPKPSDDTERAELTARIERYRQLLGSFADQRVLEALRESIADLEARLGKLK
ncbi:MAG: hypothetical protein ABSA58_05505 [Acetobacteraceae bacterium]|jgi:hypothetical protein